MTENQLRREIELIIVRAIRDIKRHTVHEQADAREVIQLCDRTYSKIMTKWTLHHASPDWQKKKNDPTRYGVVRRLAKVTPIMSTGDH